MANFIVVFPSALLWIGLPFIFSFNLLLIAFLTQDQWNRWAILITAPPKRHTRWALTICSLILDPKNHISFVWRQHLLVWSQENLHVWVYIFGCVFLEWYVFQVKMIKCDHLDSCLFPRGGKRVGSVYCCKWRFSLRQQLQTELGQPSDWWATRQMDGIFWRHAFFGDIAVISWYCPYWSVFLSFSLQIFRRADKDGE